MRNLASFTMACLLTACSTHQLNTKSAVPITALGYDIKVVVTGGSADISNQLSKYLQANLLMAGFTIVNDENATHLDVRISEFSPGNAALRLTVGFGAGRGLLVYNAKYSKAGKVLIDYDGAERFIGTEINPGTKRRPLSGFAGEETATKILLEEASNHIINAAIEE